MRKGLELARAYYEQYGRPMLEKEFPDVLDRIAAGLCGHGSECFGYDDAVSRDHDFEPGFRHAARERMPCCCADGFQPVTRPLFCTAFVRGLFSFIATIPA